MIKLFQNKSLKNLIIQGNLINLNSNAKLFKFH